jgi:hypothetical protein
MSGTAFVDANEEVIDCIVRGGDETPWIDPEVALHVQ